MQDYFDLFDIPVDFEVNKAELEKRYQRLIIDNHPDKFITHSQDKKAQALQNTNLINTAYNVLFNELKRATYLLELSGINAFDEKDTTMDSVFLMAQIEYRESLESLEQNQDIEGLEDFVDIMAQLEKEHITNIVHGFKKAQLDKVKNFIRQLRFYEQLRVEANQLLDNLL